MSILDDVQDFGGRLYDAGSGVASKTADFARDIANRGVETAKDLGGRAYDIGSGVASRATDIAEGIAGRVRDMAGRTASIAEQLFDDPVGTIENAISSAASAAATARDEAIATVTDIALQTQERTLDTLAASARRFGNITHEVTQGIATVAEEAASIVFSGGSTLLNMIFRAENLAISPVLKGAAFVTELKERVFTRISAMLHHRVAVATGRILAKVSRIAQNVSNKVIRIGNLMTGAVLAGMNFVTSTIQRFENGLLNIIQSVKAGVESVLNTLSSILPDGVIARVHSFFASIMGYVEILRTRVNRFLDFFVQQANLIGASVVSVIQSVQGILLGAVGELQRILEGVIFQARAFVDGKIDTIVSMISQQVQAWLDNVTARIVSAVSSPFAFIRNLIINNDPINILQRIARAARRVDSIVQEGLDLVLNSDIDVSDIVRTLEPIVAGTGRGITAGAGNPSEAQSQHREAPRDPRRGSRHAPGQEDPHTSPLDHARERGIRGGPGTEDLLHRGFEFIGEQIDRVMGVVRPIVQGVGQMVRNVTGSAMRTTERIIQRTVGRS